MSATTEDQRETMARDVAAGAPMEDISTTNLATSMTTGRTRGRIAKRHVRQILWTCIPPVVFVVLIAAWAGAVEFFDIPSYLLPAPGDVFARMFTDAESLWNHTLATLGALAIGFILSVLIGIPLGLLLSLSRVARQVLYPPTVVMQLIPKIAMAPLLLVWLGFGIETKVMLVVLISFFPLLLASMTGFSIMDDRLLHLTKSMGATGWQTFWFLRVPAAMPVIFSGLKTTATMAVTAVIVAEFLGSNNGLGYALLRASGVLDTEYMFAVIVVMTVVGVVLNYIIEAVEWFVTPWQRHGKRG
ncbi:ABC transporter permease [Agromyces sp. NPDC049794]|uniref:ABC transporter permease n=1 Tax=unclassified Agromyces TaxID=2639701 RepID=UPI0033E4C50B